MSYLLDTDVCIALIRNRPASARARLADVAERGMDLFVSSISLFELWYGCVRSGHPERNAERLAIFMAHPTVLNFTEDDAAVAGRIRGELEMKGRVIGACDLLVAGQARRAGLILATGDRREFERVTGLQMENWLS
ncbi:MAG TPA: type II toxin-antitoxin system VapC family toxin [Geminicoccaceae bacterium]